MRFLFFFLLIGHLAQAQTFATQGSQWHYNGHNAAPPEYSGYYFYRSTLDTVVAGRPAHRIDVERYDYTGHLAGQSQHFVSQTTDTAFWYHAASGQYRSMYIFNRSAGDTLTLDVLEDDLTWLPPTYRLVIDTVLTWVIDTTPIKVYRTTALDDYGLGWPGYFADRIGGLEWFFPRASLSIPEYPEDIRCYTDRLIDTNFNAYPCDYHLDTRTHDVTAAEALHVWPNPTSGWVHWTDAMTPWRVRVLDPLGRERLRSESLADAQLDLSILPEGVYFLFFEIKNGSTYRATVQVRRE
jgi:hypothetical protein